MTEVFEWVQSNAQADLTRRALRIAAIELGQNADGTDAAPSALTHEEPTKRLGQGSKAPGSDGPTESSGIAVPPAPADTRQSRRRRLAVVVSACTATLFAVVLLVRTIPTLAAYFYFASSARASRRAAFDFIPGPGGGVARLGAPF